MHSPISLTPSNLETGLVLPVHKPLHWTSFGVVKKLRNALQIKKIGHAGTLDPLATGLLIICTGPETKQISRYQEMEKVYRGTLVVGKTTPSIDLETAFDSFASWDHLTQEAILATVPTFVGPIEQVPPAYSAVRSQGVRAYKKARRGQSVVLPPRQVVIHSFAITAIGLPYIDFEIVCSKGTYIRSLVRDFGDALGVGAYLHALCRTRIGSFLLEEAYSLDDLLPESSYSTTAVRNAESFTSLE